jgi:hypothetical protein
MNLRFGSVREEIVYGFTVSFSTTFIIIIAALIVLSYHYSKEYDTIIEKVDEYMCLPPSVIVVKE